MTTIFAFSWRNQTWRKQRTDAFIKWYTVHLYTFLETHSTFWSWKADAVWHKLHLIENFKCHDTIIAVNMKELPVAHVTLLWISHKLFLLLMVVPFRFSHSESLFILIAAATHNIIYNLWKHTFKEYLGVSYVFWWAGTYKTRCIPKKYLEDSHVVENKIWYCNFSDKSEVVRYESLFVIRKQQNGQERVAMFRIFHVKARWMATNFEVFFKICNHICWLNSSAVKLVN